MRYIHPLLALFALAFTLTLPMQLSAQSDTSRLDELERRVTQAEHRSRGDQAAGVAVFVCGAFCALWAQQTGRNAWLWFFLGLLFSVITLLVLLYKNSNDTRGRG
jgi:fatty acid desaturase